MTALDRVTAAISDDSPVSAQSQAELVADMLARKITQRTCQACLVDFVDGYCDVCGATQQHTEVPHRAAEPRSKVCKCVSCRCEKGEVDG